MVWEVLVVNNFLHAFNSKFLVKEKPTYCKPQPDFRDLDNTPTKTTDTTEEVK